MRTYIKADVMAVLVKAGWDIPLTDKQYRRVAKRLHKWGVPMYKVAFKLYEVGTPA